MLKRRGMRSTKSETKFEEILNAIHDSLSDLPSSDDGEDGDNNDWDEKDNNQQYPPLGRMSEDDQPCSVMGTISHTVEHEMEHLRINQMKSDKLPLQGWGDLHNYIHEKDKKNGTTELKVAVIFQQYKADVAASSGPTTVGEPMETPN